MDHSFPLPIGHMLHEGRIVGLTLTAYEVTAASGAVLFVPFTRVHPTQPVAPLVVFG